MQWPTVGDGLLWSIYKKSEGRISEQLNGRKRVGNLYTIAKTTYCSVLHPGTPKPKLHDSQHLSFLQSIPNTSI
jgi:hypothetical protein